jgi:putative ABC transport system ATP-binding protein
VTNNYLELSNVSKIYNNGNKVISDVSLEIKRNEFVIIFGTSGSGKSTLVSMMGLISEASGGSYFYDDINLFSLKDHEMARLRNRKIGFIFQSYNLINDLTVIDNILLPMKYRGEKLSKQLFEKALLIMKDLNILELKDNIPSELSGGQQQRVAIARATIGDPEIIIADEPTGNLDEDNKDIVMKLLLSFHKQGKTIIMVTHEKSLFNYGTRKIEMKNGNVVKDVLI